VINLLAIDTATDACSLALQCSGERRVSHQVIPRQHQQRLFELIHELLEGRAPASLNLSAIAYGRGPGSFTGLRIAASAAQGLAYSLRIPVVGLSTLQTQAHSLLRKAAQAEPCLIISTLDARIGEIYGAWFDFDGSGLAALGDAFVCKPEALPLPPAFAGRPVVALGSGFRHPAAREVLGEHLLGCWPELMPEAQDMLAPAEALLLAGATGAAASAVPDYVQERVGWKTLAEQGRRA
jgi:tRNA threonylcarbamoyladenosine biosynthesis protein TsaB